MARAEDVRGGDGGSSLAGQRALVVGGTRNIGRELALTLAAHGADVAVTGATDAAALDGTVAAIEALGRRAYGTLADVADPDAVERVVGEAEATLGPFDLLAMCAAIRPHGDYATIPVDEYDRVMAVNLRAPFLFTQRLMPGMRERGYGRIVYFAGLSMWWGRPGRPHVAASKMGLVGLTTAMATECATDGVTVNCVVPGVIDTDSAERAAWTGDLDAYHAHRSALVPMGRLGSPAEVADAARFLLSPASAYITGQTLNVTGGAVPLVRGF